MSHIFIAYSHVDEELRNELEKHLAGLKRQGLITTWHDRRIAPGENLHGPIDNNLNAADIILLLVSADFLASDYCYDVEMSRAMERHELCETRVIPVILRPCDWHGAPFGKLNAVPPDGKPVKKHATLDDGFLKVAKAIRNVIGTANAPAPARTTVHPQTVDDLGRSTSPGPRSSNLRVPRKFTDHDCHAFFTESFEYIARYFENSLNELQGRNNQVKTEFRRIDANRFQARAFVGGQEQSLCGIWLGDSFGTDNLYFSSNGVGDGSSYNELLSLSDDGYTLFFQSIGMANFFDQKTDPALTMEGAAEYFWNHFVDRLR